MTLFLVVPASPALAQQIHVEKVKGGKAIVDASGIELEAGKTYSLVESTASGDNRSYILGGTLSYDTLNTSVSGGGTSISTKANSLLFSSRFGWNFERFEIGPLFGFTNTSIDTTDTNTFTLGIFTDYNFQPNRPGVTSVYGVSGELGIGSGSVSASAGGSTSKTSTTSTNAYLSLFGKWFPFRSAVALRGDLGYSYYKESVNTTSSTTQGLSLRGGIALYF
jgi:hypothetical protein